MNNKIRINAQNIQIGRNHDLKLDMIWPTEIKKIFANRIRGIGSEE